MFDVTGEEIGRLDDAELRTLVARLAQAEVAAGSGSLSGVIAGGSQDAGDGGIDVQVEQTNIHVTADFVPRAHTGFQVKLPSMRPADIRKEMRPSGTLRRSIAALAAGSGAYIIVSGAAGVAYSALERRRATMREAVADHPEAEHLHLDYYDRDRLATWVNLYPGVAAWVRCRIGREIAGWRPIGSWLGLQIVRDGGYLVDDGLILIDERDGALIRPVLEGIGVLRNLLRTPGSCVRLIGLSGVGKTRLVEALFEADIGEGPLDPTLAIYADYADETTPTAREMAQRLATEGRPAILIVDNCNPATHAQLAAVCGRSGSRLSLLTVEYDIRDDEPDATQVFRLVTTSEALIAEWLERDFSHVSQIDRGRIATFSGGNFRVARALAGAIRVGESLGRLRDQDLFERIFQQRKNPDQTLLRDAQILSLFYSFDVTEGSGGELKQIARLSGQTEAQLFESLSELQARGVLQARGRWRAVLPHAVANPLASGALSRLQPEALDNYCSSLSARMLKSFSRRIGMLHDVVAARALACRWLNVDGPLGDLLCEARFDVLVNLAPLIPDQVLGRLEAATTEGKALRPEEYQRGEWIRLLKALAYEPELFARAARLLARMVADEAPDENFNAARSAFQELFQLHLSGTRSPPSERQAVVAELLEQADPELRRAGRVALEALLKSQFSSSFNLDFGARPRDFGWQPTLNEDVSAWYIEALSLVRTHLRDLNEQRRVLAEALRDLWCYKACREMFEAAAIDFATNGGWLEGWSALRVILRYDGGGMPADIKAQTENLIKRLRPDNLLAEARAYVLSGRGGLWELVDDDENDEESKFARTARTAERIGRDMANNPKLLSLFAPEVLSQTAGGTQEALFAAGLAKGARELRALWRSLLGFFRGLDDGVRSPLVLGNFLNSARELDADFVNEALEQAVADRELSPHFAYLQLIAGLDDNGVERLIRVIEGADDARHFQVLGRANLDGLEPRAFDRLLRALGAKPGGVAVGLDALTCRFYPRSTPRPEAMPLLLLDLGRELLMRFDPEELNVLRDYGLRHVIQRCLSGEEGRSAARKVCEIYDTYRRGLNGWRREGQGFLQALFCVQPEIALNVFINGQDGPTPTFFRDGLCGNTPLCFLDAAVIVAWADGRPERYLALGQVVSMFAQDRSDQALGLDSTFLTLLEQAPDKVSFLGDAFNRLMPRGWSGSLANVLERRRELLADLPADPVVQAWRARVTPAIESWIITERSREAEHEETFE